MTDVKCPACDRSDVGEGRFCQACGQMLAAPKGVRLASYEQRLKAVMVDAPVLFVAAIAGLVFLIDVLGFFFDVNNTLVALLVVVGGGLFGIWALWWLVVISLGQTPGKRLAGIRVMNAATGEPAGPVRTFFRESVAKMGTGAVFGWFFGVHVLWALLDIDRQTLYDKVADTVVVDDREHQLQLSG